MYYKKISTFRRDILVQDLILEMTGFEPVSEKHI